MTSFKRVLLIKPSKTTAYSEFISNIIPLGLEYIAAYIQDHVKKVEIVDLAMESRNIEHHLKKFKPDLVGISINYSIEHNESLDIAKKAKQSGATVVAGGYHATGLAGEMALQKNIDFIVRGEGEATLLELIQKGSAEGVKGMTFVQNGKLIHNPDRPPIKDLDTIPTPARKSRKYKYKYNFCAGGYDVIMTSRGCWGKCTFCCEPMMCKGFQRYRKPKEVTKEIDALLRSQKNDEVFLLIADPNFCGNPKIAEDLCDQLIEYQKGNKFKFKFIAPVRVDVAANNERLIKKMIKAGIDVINLGIETPNETHLKLLNKGTTKDLQEKAIKNIKNNGGKVWGTFVLGLPYQKEKDIQECLNYAKQLKIDYPIPNTVTPLPGSAFYEELKSKDLLIEKNFDKYNYYTLVFKHEFFTTEQLKNLISKTIMNFYNDLFLQDEHKDRLYTFAIKIASFLKFTAAVVSSEGNNNSLQQDFSCLKELLNPNLKKHTEAKGIHNTIEMTAFLKILGRQLIQININAENTPMICLAIKTDGRRIEYINITEEAEESTSIEINLQLEQLIRNKRAPQIGPKTLSNVLADNKGFGKKINLFRLFTAIGYEALAYKISQLH